MYVNEEDDYLNSFKKVVQKFYTAMFSFPRRCEDGSW